MVQISFNGQNGILDCYVFELIFVFMFYVVMLNYMWNECRREDYIIQEESDRICSCVGFFYGLYYCWYGVVGLEEI